MVTSVPIWVGIFEAHAIAREIENFQTPRPMTHDLIKNVIAGINGEVSRVVVSDLRDNTFFLRRSAFALTARR